MDIEWPSRSAEGTSNIPRQHGIPNCGGAHWRPCDGLHMTEEIQMPCKPTWGGKAVQEEPGIELDMEEEVSEEGRVPLMIRDPGSPSQEEFHRHSVAHIPAVVVSCVHLGPGTGHARQGGRGTGGARGLTMPSWVRGLNAHVVVPRHGVQDSRKRSRCAGRHPEMLDHAGVGEPSERRGTRSHSGGWGTGSRVPART